MLVNKKVPEFKTGDIVSIKTTNGEEIIAKVVEEHHGCHWFEKPLALQPNQSGQIAFVPPIFSAKDDAICKLYTKNILWMTHTHEDAEAAYLTASTGIETPPLPKIVIPK